MKQPKHSYDMMGWLVLGQGESIHKCPHCVAACCVSKDTQYQKWIEQTWTCPECDSEVTTSKLNDNQVL